MNYTNIINCFCIAIFLSFNCNYLKAQTYATPELKAKAEKWEKERNVQLGIKEPIIKESQKIELPKFDKKILFNPDNYILSKVEAIDIENKHTTEDMQKFSDEAKREFDAKNYVVNLKDKYMYIVRRNDDTRFGKIDFTINNNSLVAIDCIPCRDNAYKIVEQTLTLLVLDLKPQDEGKYFVFRFTFNKNK